MSTPTTCDTVIAILAKMREGLKGKTVHASTIVVGCAIVEMLGLIANEIDIVQDCLVDIKKQIDSDSEHIIRAMSERDR